MDRNAYAKTDTRILNPVTKSLSVGKFFSMHRKVNNIEFL